ncbi:MAG: ROK family transcriptional regulator [Micrococcales bacterium]|nr:ROK family transcriptional regulator [Micrococcales bacterium]
MVTAGPGSQGALRQANLRRVLEEVRTAGSLTQAEIARRTGLSAASVTNLVRKLSQAGAVQVEDSTDAGRRCRRVKLGQTAGYVLGIDLGRSHLLMCIADLSWNIVVEGQRTMRPETEAKAGLALCQELQAELMQKAGLSAGRVLYGGVGVPGPLEVATGHIGAGTLLPQWTGMNLKTAFEQALDLPMVVDNDANLGALGEFSWQRPNRPDGTMIYLRLATGIGGGMMVDGRLHRGAAGTAGEIGHMTIDADGRLCRCGNRGCLETKASTPVMLEVLASALDRPVDIDTWMGLVNQGHTASVRLIEEVGRCVGTAVSNLCNLLSPDHVVLGGPVTQAGDRLLNQVRDEVQRRAVPATWRAVKIEASHHGSRSEMYGAVVLAREALLAATPLASLLESLGTSI